MARLPVIVAQGGISSAGRTSGFNAYRRMVYHALSSDKKQRVLHSLHALCHPTLHTKTVDEKKLLLSTLIRKISLFNTQSIPCHKKISVAKESQFIIKNEQLSDFLSHPYSVTPIDSQHSQVTFEQDSTLLTSSTITSPVHFAGQLPEGFVPEKTYASKSHPRGLAMTIYGASDAIQSMGIDWEWIRQIVCPDQIAVYAGSGMSQLDENGNGGLLQARLKGQRVSAKQLPLGFAEMPADFINAYILGNLGRTGTNVGACATFLYNLHQGIEDIRSGRARLCVVGNSEAPITPEIIDGYTTMGALATDQALRKLDHLNGDVSLNYARSCRPFAQNAGFVLGESAQFFVLMDDELALQSGASILGSVADVFINADGYKKSIASPGAGNYITVAKAVALGQQLFDETALKQSVMYAHGTGTPQNRVTESHIMSQVAHCFSIPHWPITAIKSYVGHSISAAAGDQLLSILGAWKDGFLPGIHSVDQLASDIYQDHLHFVLQHENIDTKKTPLMFLNAKGFGGNNATATIISPHMTENMLIKKYGKTQWKQWKQKNEKVDEISHLYETKSCQGKITPTYQFSDNILTPTDIQLSKDAIKLGEQTISLCIKHSYQEFL